jgi:NAD(P)-dependent dehydrogenase (short-subunit alcohol dehydrogenase family)
MSGMCFVSYRKTPNRYVSGFRIVVMYLAQKSMKVRTDIANVVSFLCGPDASWVDDQTLRVNGGMV